MPHSGCDDAVALSNIRAGKTPERPSEGIPDSVWQLLQKCWSMDTSERPSATQMYNALSNFRSVRPVIEELPGKLKLQVRSIKFLFNRFNKARKRRFFVKFKYGNEVYKTSLTRSSAVGDDYMWSVFHSSPSSLLSLSPGQVQLGKLVDKNRRSVS